jgi:uncharacterized protein (TIGR02147 family)
MVFTTPATKKADTVKRKSAATQVPDSAMPDIFQHLNYREFLRDWMAGRKAEGKPFSYRYLAQKTGLKSPAFFTYVLQGKRNLSPHLALKFAEAMKLSKKETAFFELLVCFNQAKSLEERKHHFDKIAGHRQTGAHVISSDKYAYYEKWYHSAIREWISIHPYRGDAQTLAKILTPSVSPEEVRRSVELLERLGFVKRRTDGLYERAEATLTTGDQWKSLAIHQFQAQCLELAKSALEKFPKEERDISTMTFSCSQSTFETIVEKIGRLRQEIAALAEQDDKPETIFQTNFQIFPLTRKKSPEGGNRTENWL